MAEILNYVDIDQQLNSIYNYKQHPITSASMVISSSILGVNDKGFAVYNIDDNSPYWWDGVEFKTFPSSSGGYIDTGSLVLTSSFNNFTSSYNTGSFTGSFTGHFNGSIVSSSYSLSSSQALSSSYYNETDPVFTLKSSSLATTGSNLFNGDQTISGSVTIKYNDTIKNGIVSDIDNSYVFSQYNDNYTSISVNEFGAIITTSDVNGSSQLSSVGLSISNADYGMTLEQGKLSLQSSVYQPFISIAGISGSTDITTDLLSDSRQQALPDKDGTFAMLSDISSSSSPSLQKNYVAVGQSGDVIGGTSNLSFLNNSSLRVIADNSPSDGIFLSDGLLEESYAGLYSSNSDQEIIAFSPNNSNYRLFDNKYNYSTITGIHNISGSLIVTEYITGSLFGTSSFASTASYAPDYLQISSTGSMLAPYLTVSNPTFNGLLSGSGITLTGTSAKGLVDLKQTWNTTGNPTAFKVNITNTASGVNSLLFDFQLNGTSLAKLNKDGLFITSNGLFAGTGAVQGAFFAPASNVFIFGNNYLYGAVGTAVVATSGAKSAFIGNYSWSPTSGTSTMNIFNASPTINQTGGANGITSGLKVNPTLTSAFDFRALDITNGSIVLPITPQSSKYAVKTSDYLINATSGTFTVTLPTAVGCDGKHYIIKNSGSGNITVATTSSQTIDGSTTYSLATQYKYVHVVSDGTNWIIIGNN